MMKFTLGLAIIAFTLIVGSYKFIENDELIAARKFGLKDAIARRDETRMLKAKVQSVKKIGMVEGKDQKFSIERMLDIGTPGLEFSFVGQGRGANDATIYRHSFRIEGPADFASTMRVLRDLSKSPGFVVNKICYACRTNRTPLPDGQVIIQIEGFLYVYNPNKLG